SFSAGVSVYPKDGADAIRLLKVADEAMYNIKRNRKNRVCRENERREP
ncbi:diguanylate cyclase domain-containing protein, partial [Bartonella sp. CL29QHWL]